MQTASSNGVIKQPHKIKSGCWFFFCGCVVTTWKGEGWMKESDVVVRKMMEGWMGKVKQSGVSPTFLLFPIIKQVFFSSSVRSLSAVAFMPSIPSRFFSKTFDETEK